MDLYGLKRGMTLGHCTKKGKLGQYGRELKTASTRLGADVVIFTMHKDNPGHTSIALLSFTYLKEERKDSTTIPMFQCRDESADIILDSEADQPKLEKICKYSPFKTNCEIADQVRQSIKRLTAELQVFISRLPKAIQPYVIRATDVSRDGHCGFSVISLLTGNANGWKNVRSELLKALSEPRYLQIYTTEEIQNLKAIVDCFEKETLDTDEHWLTLPFMGPLIASCFNAVLFVFDDAGCGTTYGPHFESILPPDEFAIGFMNGDHFIQLHLEAGHPVPKPYYHVKTAHRWFQGLTARHTKWNKASNITPKSHRSQRKDNKGESSSRPEPTRHPGNHEEEDVHEVCREQGQSSSRPEPSRHPGNHEEDNVDEDLAIGPFHEETFGTKIQCGVREANEEGHSSRSQPTRHAGIPERGNAFQDYAIPDVNDGIPQEGNALQDDAIPFNEEMGRTYMRYRVPGRSSRSQPTWHAGIPEERNRFKDDVIPDVNDYVNDGIPEEDNSFHNDAIPFDAEMGRTYVRYGVPEAKEVHHPGEEEGRPSRSRATLHAGMTEEDNASQDDATDVTYRVLEAKEVHQTAEEVHHKTSQEDESLSPVASRTRGRDIEKAVSNDDRKSMSPVASRTRGRKGVSNDDMKSKKVSDKASKRDESTSALGSRTRGRKKDSHDDTELREIREEITKLEKKSEELRTQLEHLRNRE